ncbi:hypothetical protein HMPREF0578_1043 [Mobiluncus mulieris 28-1]|uniref:cell wall-binding repeat-containing protein n=1 Tax=Mobiluncus mulieris TaxID=2052 RepID=UPI0001BE7BAD|nr:cell wall-binding repeat 2 family protein [Mobiluncus mulieris]EEZ91801.1 hypothetical protein HMPREF0578_1043 [Mobiluncus mulieris 28-1]
MFRSNISIFMVIALTLAFCVTSCAAHSDEFVDVSETPMFRLGIDRGFPDFLNPNVPPNETLVLVGEDSQLDPILAGLYAKTLGTSFSDQKNYSVIVGSDLKDAKGILENRLNNYRDEGIKKLIIIGGSMQVDTQTERWLRGGRFKVTRLAGSNRYETSLKVWQTMSSHYPDTARQVFVGIGTKKSDVESVTLNTIENVAAASVAARVGGSFLSVDPHNPKLPASLSKDAKVWCIATTGCEKLKSSHDLEVISGRDTLGTTSLALKLSDRLAGSEAKTLNFLDENASLDSDQLFPGWGVNLIDQDTGFQMRTRDYKKLYATKSVTKLRCTSPGPNLK